MKNKILVFLLLAVLTLSLLCSCKKEHTHSFSGAFSTDDSYHWHQCECGEKDGYEQHSWNNGVVTLQPTVESEGEKLFTCSVCRAKKTEIIEKLSPDHSHSFDIIKSDENYHWNECVCGEQTEKKTHTWDSGRFDSQPTQDGYDVKIYTCLICNETREELVDASVVWYDDEKVDLDYAYSFAVVGDTQFVCQKYPDKMEAIYDWIVANKDSRKIAHVFGLGDITEGIWDVSNVDEEWIRAKEYISKLDGVVPYSLVRGNHDESSFFDKYFANDTYMSQFDGFMNGDDIRNSYRTMTIGSTDYLFITLDYGANDEELEWANKIVESYPDHKVIVTTHAYMYRDGTRLNIGDTALPSDHSDADKSPLRIYNDGQQIWEKFVSKHPNILLVLSGHDPSENLITTQSVGDHGNVVTQMLIDPQGMDNDMGGVGMICMLYFSADGSKMEVEWYSAGKEQYYKPRNQYTVDLSGACNEAHNFKYSFDSVTHTYSCDCGYVSFEENHEFADGSLNSDSLMVYSCSCGYELMTSDMSEGASKDLAFLIGRYHNSGNFFKETVVGSITEISFYGNMVSEAYEYDITLDDLIHMANSLNGWTYSDGKYSTTHSGTLEIAKLFFVKKESNGAAIPADKLTVEEVGYNLIIKMWSGNNVTATATIGAYATSEFVTLDGKTLQLVYTKADEKGICNIEAPSFDDCVAEYDRYVININHDPLNNVIYCSPISMWDGVSESTSLSGSGTADDPYLIQSAEDFAYLRNDKFSKKHFKLTVSVDLDFNELVIDVFDGILDGNHCSIRGIDVYSTTNNTGLFNILQSSSIVYDLSLYGNVRGAQYTGALAGVAHGEVRGVVNFATVSGAGNLGGIIGNSANTSRVTFCQNYGNINGSSWNNGGIVGFAQNSVLYCVNHGDVTTSGDCAGGIVGSSHSFVTHCINYGKISSPGRAGGISYNSKKLIDSCINYGDVVGSLPHSWDIGGILGFVAADYSAIVSNCVNNGNVVGATCIGGILGAAGSKSGYAASVIITNCVNNGNITATWGGGGIAGSTEFAYASEISGSTNFGSVKGNGNLGGIIGKTNGNVTECTNNGIVAGTNDIIGGIVGQLMNTAYGKTVWTTNYQKGSVSGPNSQEIIGKGYVYTGDESDTESGPLTEEEFNSQPAMFGSPWVNNSTRMKILVKIRMTKGTTITFLGDTSVYCWGVMETTDKENASAGAWKDSGWNTSWDDPGEKTYTTTYATGYFVITVGKLDASGKPTIALTQAELDNIHSMFRVEGIKAVDDESGSLNNPWLNEDMVSINHRGWYEAPENTLSAYRESYNHGFKYVECDVQFTKDGIPVLLHDDTIDRTSNGSGNVSQMTYAELLQYDFSYDDNDKVNDFSAYRGEKIPTFTDFIALCKELGLHPYIEIKGSITTKEAEQLVKIVSDAGMLDSVSWLGFSGDALAKIVSLDPTARLVWVLTDTYDTKIAANNIPFAQANLMTGESEVVFDLYYTLVTQSIVDLLEENNIPLEVWTVNDSNVILNLHPYVSGVTSDMCNAKEILTEAGKLN